MRAFIKRHKILMALVLVIVTPIMIDYGRLSYPSKDTPNMVFLHRASVSEMKKGLRESFPPGTPKSYVEKALVEKGGAVYGGKVEVTYGYPHEYNVHRYDYRKPIYLRFLHDGRYVIAIFYDENNLVKEEVETIDGRTIGAISISGPLGL